MGDEARFQCQHKSSTRPNITWWFLTQGNDSYSPKLLGSGQGSKDEWTIPKVNKSHRGIYRCKVEANGKFMHSCGTYLRVRGE